MCETMLILQYWLSFFWRISCVQSNFSYFNLYSAQQMADEPVW